MDRNLPGSSVHGISQARILEWVAIPFSRGSSRPGDGTQESPTLTGRSFTAEPPGKPQSIFGACEYTTLIAEPGGRNSRSQVLRRVIGLSEPSF